MKKLLLISSLFVASSQLFADTLAQWTFETDPVVGTYSPGANTSTTNFYADAGLQAGTASATGFHSVAATAYSSPAGNGTAKSLSANNWSANDYWQLQLNTTGYSGLSLSYDQTGSSTGPRDFVLSYSINGGSSFTTIGSTYTVPVSTWNATTTMTGFTQTYDLGAFTDLENQSSVLFRIKDVDTTAINGGTVGTTGTDRIDNFSVFTTPIPEPSTVALGVLGGFAGLFFWFRRR